MLTVHNDGLLIVYFFLSFFFFYDDFRFPIFMI